MNKRYLFIIIYSALSLAFLPTMFYAMDGFQLFHLSWLPVYYALVGAAGGGLFVLHHELTVRARWRKYRMKLSLTHPLNLGSIDLSQNLVVPCNAAETFRLCRESVSRLNGARIVDEDRAAGRLTARTASSYASYGELIEYRVDPIGDRFSDLAIRSHPVRKTTMLDYGSNLSNLAVICDYLQGNTDSPHLGELA